MKYVVMIFLSFLFLMGCAVGPRMSDEEWEAQQLAPTSEMPEGMKCRVNAPPPKKEVRRVETAQVSAIPIQSATRTTVRRYGSKYCHAPNLYSH